MGAVGPLTPQWSLLRALVGQSEFGPSAEADDDAAYLPSSHIKSPDSQARGATVGALAKPGQAEEQAPPATRLAEERHVHLTSPRHAYGSTFSTIDETTTPIAMRADATRTGLSPEFHLAFGSSTGIAGSFGRPRGTPARSPFRFLLRTCDSQSENSHRSNARCRPRSWRTGTLDAAASSASISL